MKKLQEINILRDTKNGWLGAKAQQITKNFQSWRKKMQDEMNPDND